MISPMPCPGMSGQSSQATLPKELEQTIQSGAIPLGVLSWERYKGTLRASKFIFPWLRETLVISQIFDDLCNEAARSVEAELVLQTGPVN